MRKKIIFFVSIILLSLLLISCGQNQEEQISQIVKGTSDLPIEQLSKHSVTLLREGSCTNKLKEEFTCYDVDVSCNGLNKRKAIIRIKENKQSIGTIIFTSNGAGTTFYGNAATQVIKDLQEQGFETVEIAWKGEFGWAQDNSGIQIPNTMCAYAELTKYVKDNLANNNQTICATGNSGGSMQISYGLTNYNLEDIFDFVLLSGGPPTANAVDACLAKQDDGTNTARLLDYSFGFLEDENKQYCQKGNTPQEIQTQIDKNSIVPTNKEGLEFQKRDFDYSHTTVSFVQGEKDTANIPRAKTYYDAITSSKTWIVLKGVTHSVHKDDLGAKEITSQLITHCKEQQ